MDDLVTRSLATDSGGRKLSMEGYQHPGTLLVNARARISVLFLGGPQNRRAG